MSNSNNSDSGGGGGGVTAAGEVLGEGATTITTATATATTPNVATTPTAAAGDAATTATTTTTTTGGVSSSSRRLVHLSGGNRAAAVGNVVGWLKQASIEVRDAGTRTLSMLQSTNPNFRSLDLSLSPSVTSAGLLPTATSAESSFSTVFGFAQDTEDSCDTKFSTRTRAYASVSQPQSPRHRVRGSSNGLNGRSTSMSSHLERTKKLLRMADGVDRPLTLLHFNDIYNIHPQSEEEPIGGATRFASALKKFTQLNPLILFSGDCFSPSVLSTYTQGEQMVPVLNHIGTTTAVFGNHDFDHGMDQLMKLTKRTHFPWLMSNVVDNETGRPLGGGKITHFVLHQNIPIGIVGLVEREWLETLPTIDPAEVTYIDFVEAGIRLAHELRNEGCELVIALTHMRTPNDLLLAEKVPGIDIILGGHDHVREVTEINGTLVVKSGTDFRQFSVVTIARVPNERSKFTTDVQCVDVTSDIPEDPILKEELSKYDNIIETRLSDVLGVFSVDLDGRFSQVRTQETNLGNWACDVLLAAIGSDVVLLNGGTFRSDRIHSAGPFTMGDLTSIIPMRDPLVLVEVTGRLLWKILENGVSAYPKLEGRFPQVAGISFAFDPNAKDGKRVDPALIQVGEDYLVLDKIYSLCVKNYLYMGCDGYTMLKDAKVLIDAESCPELGLTLQNHFKSITARKTGQGSKHRQPLVTLPRKNSLLHTVDTLDMESTQPMRKRSIGHDYKNLDSSGILSIYTGCAHKMLRRASLDDLEQTSCDLAPKVGHRIIVIQNKEHHRQLTFKKDLHIMNTTIAEADDDYKSMKAGKAAKAANVPEPERQL